MGRVGGHSFKSLLHCGSISLCFSADCCSVWNPLRRDNWHVRFCLDELIKRKNVWNELTRISEWLISGIKGGSTWDRVIQRQKTGQSRSRYRKSFYFLTNLIWDWMAWLTVWPQHGLDLQSCILNLKLKKKGFWHAVTVVIIRNVIWHQCWVNCHILHLLFPQ